MLFKVALSALLASLASGAKLAAPTFPETDGITLEQASKFRSWVSYHGKKYDSSEERKRRMEIWVDNHERIEAHNSQDPAPSYTMAHNKFSDMTHEEFIAFFKLGKHADFSEQQKMQEAGAIQRSMLELPDPLTLPESVNWVDSGAVTPVKNQGACGGCWAFSATGALEGAKFLNDGELVSLSEQNLIDCDHKDLGCNGGLMDDAFKFDEKQGGLCSEAEYPYQAHQGKCDTTCEDVAGTDIQYYVDVPTGDKNALMSAIATQPVSIAIEAGTFAFQFYQNGVIADDSCGRNGSIDHGVLAVGYGTDADSGKEYFLVKNSWGEDWGDAGFVKIGRESKNQYGICSILALPSFPVVE